MGDKLLSNKHTSPGGQALPGMHIQAGIQPESIPVLLGMFGKGFLKEMPFEPRAKGWTDAVWMETQGTDCSEVMRVAKTEAVFFLPDIHFSLGDSTSVLIWGPPLLYSYSLGWMGFPPFRGSM